MPFFWGYMVTQFGMGLSHVKQISVGSGPVEIEGIPIYAVYEQPVWGDMALPSVSIIPNKHMVFVGGRQRCRDAEGVHNFVQQAHVISPLYAPLSVLFEFGGGIYF